MIKNINNISVCALLMLLVCISLQCAYRSNTLILHNLRVEALYKPVGIDTQVPKLSWHLSSGREGAHQRAYRILVASSISKLKKDEGDIWDSGKVVSTASVHIPYEGDSLQSGRDYYWAVKVWDNYGNESQWSEPAHWSMGLLNKQDWKASWISYDTTRATTQPIFRKEFSLPDKVKKATAYISGLGYYELYLNGEKVGDHVLDPGQTNYDDYALYASYDITDQLTKGENAIGVMLGDGWYNQDFVWEGMSYGIPMFICQIEVELADGTKLTVTSDENWKWTNGPIIMSNVYAGEVYDARKEIDGWSTAAPAKAEWMQVELSSGFPPSLKAQMLPPIKKMKELEVKQHYKVDEDTYVFDFGQNFAGWVRLNVQAPEGTHIVMRSAEEVFPDGSINPASTGVFATNVVQTDEYITKGEGIEVWEPRFTYHGFRYVEVSGLTSPPTRDLLTGIVAYSSVQKAGSFKSSSDQINRLHKMARWTLISNLHSVPTDCPHREKAGWLGDTHAMAEMSMYNYDMEAFWIKYLYDIRSSARVKTKTLFFNDWETLEQREKPAGVPFMVSPGKRSIGAATPDWGTAMVQIPWYLYIYYGNKGILKEFYPDMQKWVSHVKDLSSGDIVEHGLGDWCPPGRIVPVATPMALTSTAFHYLDIQILEQVAHILGYNSDAENYRRMGDEVKSAFIERFYDRETKTYGSQTGNVMALTLGLVPHGDEHEVSDQIVRLAAEQHDGFINTGIFGLSRIFDALSSYGNSKSAYNILNKTGYNSFAYMWNAYDATTLWEILPVNDFYKKKKDAGQERSHNHPMQAGYDAWFYQGILGINPDPKQPGFKNILFKPVFFEQLDWADGTYRSPYGLIQSDWAWKKGVLEWKISIPPSTTADLRLPYTYADIVKIDGEVVQGERVYNESGKMYYQYSIQSGDHVVKLSKR